MSFILTEEHIGQLFGLAKARDSVIEVRETISIVNGAMA